MRCKFCNKPATENVHVELAGNLVSVMVCKNHKYKEKKHKFNHKGFFRQEKNFSPEFFHHYHSESHKDMLDHLICKHTTQEGVDFKELKVQALTVGKRILTKRQYEIICLVFDGVKPTYVYHYFKNLKSGKGKEDIKKTTGYINFQMAREKLRKYFEVQHKRGAKQLFLDY